MAWLCLSEWSGNERGNVYSGGKSERGCRSSYTRSGLVRKMRLIRLAIIGPQLLPSLQTHLYTPLFISTSPCLLWWIINIPPSFCFVAKGVFCTMTQGYPWDDPSDYATNNVFQGLHQTKDPSRCGFPTTATCIHSFAMKTILHPIPKHLHSHGVSDYY